MQSDRALDSFSLSLELTADTRWIPVVQGFIEKGTPVMGLEEKKILPLSVSSEEIIAHIAKVAPGCKIVLKLERQAAKISAEFRFRAVTGSGLWAMNLTSSAEITPDQQGMEHLGLLLASRMTDSFSISLNRQDVGITLEQHLTYPETNPLKPDNAPLSAPIFLEITADSSEISRACALTLGSYSHKDLPGFINTPGVLIDRIAYGELHMAIAKDDTARPAGMILWENISAKSIGFYGPYIFGKGAGDMLPGSSNGDGSNSVEIKTISDIGDNTSIDDNMSVAKSLTSHMIGSVARTPAMILVSKMTTKDLPPGEFESLTDGDDVQKIWFRHLREDMGINVWSHPKLTDFLKETYDRLFLMRTINDANGVSNSSRSQPGTLDGERSLLAADLDTGNSRANLCPMLDGFDLKDNICKHLNLLKAEGFVNIFFTLDLARGWQAAMGGTLLENGFTPAYVLPYAGDSDKVIFKYVEKKS